MTAPAAEPPPTAAPDAAPRVLLFGHPAAGKSSLLGALLQASDTQPDALGAELADPGRRIEQLRDAVYGQADVDPVRTSLVTHRVVVQPLADEGEAPPAAFPVVIVDVDGAAANALLKHPDNPLADLGIRAAPVAKAVAECDVLVLAIAADSSEAELRQGFEDFLLFLERLHGRKTFAREVGGFPILLALTRSDRLAHRGDTAAKWEARVAERLADLVGRLTQYLEIEGGSDSPYLPFGSVEVRGYAAAVRRPKLADEPARPDEPFGVAELFRDCFAAARGHRERVAASDRRLKWTVQGVLATVAAMVFGLLLVVAFQPPATVSLADRVRDYRDRNDPPEARLAAKHIAHTERLLRSYRDDPGFDDLPPELMRFVVTRLDEVDAYRKLKATLDDPGPMIPAEARTKAQLDAVQARLSTIAIPAEWARTEAAVQRAKWLDDVALIDRAVKGWTDWYWLQAGTADSLARTDTFGAAWLAAIESLRTRAEKPTVRDVLAGAADRDEVRLDQPVPGARPAQGPRDKVVTFGTTYWFEQAALARDQWIAARDRLLDLRGLADALALSPGDAARPPSAALFVPPNVGAPPAERADRVEKALGPDFNPARRWALDRFDEPTRGRLAARLDESRENAEAAVKGELRAKLDELARAGRPDPQRWQDLGAAAASDPRFRGWGRFLTLLARLRDPTAPDPVAELAAFLRRDRFDLTLTGFELRVPVGYQPRGKPVALSTVLTVTAGPTGATPLRFKLAGQADAGVWTVYHFTPEGDGKLSVRPGDAVRVSVGANVGDGGAAELVWAEGGPPAFQFARLHAPPEPKLAQAGAEPRAAPGVKLTPLAGTAIPPLPALLPVP